MQDVLFESVAEVAGLVFYAVVAGVLTTVGALAEIAASENLTAGQTTLGLWEAGVGIILLYAGYNVLNEFVLPYVRRSDSAA